MKIFISYGHNDYTPLVDRLFDALIDAGHQPWKDDRYEGSSGIAPGQDFTEVIYEAIEAADFVIAFVTRNTQKKPYCRDERQYAYNKKGSHFIQLRMDNVEITLGNAQSYIDMSDTVDSTGCIREKLFENSLKAIFAAFRDPKSFAEGGITPWAKIDTHLKVPGSLKYHDFIATLEKSDFVGREWLMEKCKVWAQDASISRRLFVIFGEAGTGKTAFIRRLSQNEELVRSVHVCIYDRPSTRTVRDTLKNLAYVLACKCETYYSFLKTENLEKIKDMQEDAMFEYLFLEPLKSVQEKYLLIIDGLDELEETSGLKPLMRIFRQYADRINPNISFLVTTRPDEAITDLIKTVGKGKALESVTLSKDANKDDLLLYILQNLQTLGFHSEDLAKQILDACDGNFEYLSLLFQEAEEEGLRMSEDLGLPRGLNERYIQYLNRHMDARELTKLSKHQRQLLSVLCAAREPLPLSLLADVTGLDEYDVQDELDVFGSLIHQSGGHDQQISLFTKSFRDFLLSKDCRRYSASLKTGTSLLAEYMMENIHREKDFAKQPYLDRNGFVHLLQYAQEEPEETTTYINRLSSKNTETAKRIADALRTDTKDAISAFFKIYSAIDVSNDVFVHLMDLRAAEPLTEFSRLAASAGDNDIALKLQSDILCWNLTEENIRQAEQLYIQSYNLTVQRYRNQPSQINGHNLCQVGLKLGTLYLKRHTAEAAAQAKKWFMKTLASAEENYRQYPGFMSRHDLSVANSFLGDLARKEATPESLIQSKTWFSKALELDKQNYTEHPCHKSRQTLSIAYFNHGELTLKENTPDSQENARLWFSKALEVAKENYQEEPCYNSRLYLADLYVSFGKLASTARESKFRKQAFVCFIQAFKLYTPNYQEQPSYSSRLKLSVCLELLFDITLRTNPALIASLCVLPVPAQFSSPTDMFISMKQTLSKQNYAENPCFESRRDLSSAYSRAALYSLYHITTPNHVSHALKLFQEALVLDEQNYQENPCYISRKELSSTCSTMGMLIGTMKQTGTKVLAEQFFRKSLELDKQNYLDYPTKESQLRLSESQKRLDVFTHKTNVPEQPETDH